MTEHRGRGGAVAVAMLAAACASSGGAASFPYEPGGTIERATTEKYEWIRDHPSLPAGCGVSDNRWNEVHAAPGRHAERVFVEDLDGTPAFGWQWVWPTGYDVVSYPEVVCGFKPWDLGQGGFTIGGAFPFQPDSATLTVDYQVATRAHGTHNLTFSLWAVSDPDAPMATLANEIMVWIDNAGMSPAGSIQGSVESGGTTFDVWINPGQTDHSGASPAVWTYVAFVARTPRTSGPLALGPLLDWLRAHDLPGSPGRRILAAGAWIGDLELGSEVVGGAGVVEVTAFGYQVEAR